MNDGDTITVGAARTSLERELEELEISERIEIIKGTALLRSARILRRVLEIWWDLQSLRFQWKIIC